MTRRSRALIALLLVLALPLRVMAALAMPCCPMEVGGDHPHASMAMSSDVPDDRSNGVSGHGAPGHTFFDCCAFAMMVPPAARIVSAAYAPPFATPSPARTDVGFVTDAPDRPPRATTTLI